MYLISLVVLVIAVVVFILRERLTRWHKNLPGALLILLSAIACGSYISNAVNNYWDSFHYYIGAKYFPELGYTKLYECASIADSQDPRWSRRLSGRIITNLEDNTYIKAEPILNNPERCMSGFTQGRWDEFKSDVKFFRDRLGYELWEMVLGDRGYNATPFWTSYAHIIFNKIPLSQNGLVSLIKVDYFLLVGSLLILMWQFGAVAGGAISILLLTMPLLTPGWVLGGLFRLDWFFLVVLSIVAIKRESYLTAGLLLAISIGLRLYPVIFLFGLLVYFYHHRNDKTILPAIKNFTLGVLVGGVLIFNMIISQFNIDSISDSYKNLAKLQGTTLTNKVGINSILGYSEDNRLELSFDKSKYDAYVKWRGGVRKNQEQWRPLYMFIGGAILFLLIYSTRKMDVVGSYVSSLSLMILIDPMNYYYVIFPLLLIAVRDSARILGFVFLPSILGLVYLMMNPEVISSVVHQDIKFLLSSYLVSAIVLMVLFIVMFMKESSKWVFNDDSCRG